MPAFEQHVGIDIPIRGGKVNVPNILVDMHGLDTPFAHAIKPRGNGSDHPEGSFLFVDLIDDLESLPRLERARKLHPGAMAVHADRASHPLKRNSLVIHAADTYGNTEHDARRTALLFFHVPLRYVRLKDWPLVYRVILPDAISKRFRPVSRQ